MAKKTVIDEAFATALLQAAEQNDSPATQRLLRSLKDDPPAQRQAIPTLKATFVTACKNPASPDAARKLYLYLKHRTAERDVLAWGARKAANPQFRDFLESEKTHASWTSAYDAHETLLNAAKTNDIALIHAANLGKTTQRIWDATSFVFREAAQIAIENGNDKAAEALLPMVNPVWLSDLENLADTREKPEIAALIHQQAAHPPVRKPTIDPRLIRALA